MTPNELQLWQNQNHHRGFTLQPHLSVDANKSNFVLGPLNLFLNAPRLLQNPFCSET